ncbi:MAG: hypothetical protein WBL15_11640 [Phycisphaerae bacterium]
MPTHLTYAEKLRDPRWQRKRLEIMERAGFHCEACGSDQDALNVHHGYYERGLEPWEYPSETLHCLCERCHLEHHAAELEVRRDIGKLGIGEICQVLGYVRAMLAEHHEDESKIVDVGDYVGAIGVGHYFRISPDRAMEVLDKEGTVSALMHASIEGAASQ